MICYGDRLMLGEYTLECWTTLSALADLINRICLGTTTL